MAKAGDGKPRSNKRRASHQLFKRVSADELDAFKKRAGDAGFKNHRDYLSAFVLSGSGLDRDIRRTLIAGIGQLGKIGSNVNQIAKAINEGRVKRLNGDDLRVLNEAHEAVEAAAAEVREVLKR